MTGMAYGVHLTGTDVIRATATTSVTYADTEVTSTAAAVTAAATAATETAPTLRTSTAAETAAGTNRRTANVSARTTC